MGLRGLLQGYFYLIYLFISISSVQLHDSLGSTRSCECSEAVSIVKMTTVLEECRTEEQRCVVGFFVCERLNAKDIHIEMFPVSGGKCLSRKAVHNWDEKFSQGRSKVADDGLAKCGSD
jgi:hypothetical protein